MLAKLFGSIVQGIQAVLISVEVSVTKGIGYQITGLADESIKESLSRIAIALQQNGFHMPRTKLLIHLGPANIRKSGSALDLPIALAILLATEQIHDIGKLSQYIISGELSLDGTIKPVSGALCRAELSLQHSFNGIILPAVNHTEAALIPNANVFTVTTLNDAIDFIGSDIIVQPVHRIRPPVSPVNYAHDFKDITGQSSVKRALEIAAAGGHHLLIDGFPGTGKSMLTKCLPSILPPMNEAEIIETTKIYSIAANQTVEQLIGERPYREIHHSTSVAGLIGGGTIVKPGEITLAHNGVLFMDEFTEFPTAALEALRQPLEEKKINITRANSMIQYPASFMLVAAMNPCLCGYYHHPVKKCICSKRALWWHKRKLSGPILDRFDLCATTELLQAASILTHDATNESSAMIRQRVIKARQLQSKRLSVHPHIRCNAELTHPLIQAHCVLEDHAEKYLRKKWDRLSLSMRGLDKILKVARTIADLADCLTIELPHIAEAIHFKIQMQQLPATQSPPKNKPAPDYKLNGDSPASRLLQ